MIAFRKCLLPMFIPLALLTASAAGAQQRYTGVVEHILDAWKTADVVCLGEDHDRYYDNELRIALVQHPSFPRTVRVIVVELANPVHQDLLDRFILDGAEMSREEIALIWRDATSPEVWRVRSTSSCCVRFVR